MSYVNERISREDEIKIIENFSCDKRRQRRVMNSLSEGPLSKTWAVDRRKNFYLLSAPREMREQTNLHYFFLRERSVRI